MPKMLHALSTGRPLRLASAALLAASLPLPAPPASTVTISHEHLRMAISKLSREGKSRLEITTFEDPSLGVSLDLRSSPLFEAILLDTRRPEAPRLVIEGPGGGDPPRVPEGNLEIHRTSDQALAIDVRGLALQSPPSRQRLSVHMEVRLRPRDGGALWTASASLQGKGSFVILALRYPMLRVGTIGPSGVDDELVLPLTGGIRLENPTTFTSIPDPDAALFAPANPFVYPGYMDCQFLAFYDARRDFDTATGGLYMAAEDPDGYHKILQGRPSKTAGRLDLFLEHVNLAPDPYPEATASLEGMRTFSLGDKLPYTVVTRPFRGDWMDAADLYRRWFETARPAFLSRGPLVHRSDVSRATREILYDLAYRFSGGTRPVDTKRLATNPDLEALRRTLAFFSDGHGSPLPAGLTLLGDITALDIPGNANDMGVVPLRQGMREWVLALRGSPPGSAIVSLGLNRDMGNWSSNRAEDPEGVRNNGLVCLPDGKPLRRRPATETDPGVHGICCNGSRFVLDMRREQFRRAFGRLMDGGRSLVDNVALSGRGTQSYPCFAPLFAGKRLALHHHTLGGGNFSAQGYRDTVRALRRDLGDRVGHLFPGGERSHEQLIDTSLLSGRFQVDPWDETFHGASIWIRGGGAIPLLSYLYHEWDLLTARLPRRANVVRAYAKARDGAASPKSIRKLLGDEGFLALERERFAAATIEGRRIAFYLEGRGGGLHDRTDRLLEAPPGEAPEGGEGLDENFRFLREMIRLRGRALPWLVYGRMLRPPGLRSPGSRVRVPVLVRREVRSASLPGVLASAWRSPDGVVAVVVADYSGRDSAPRLRLPPDRWGLEGGGGVRLVDEAGGVVGLHAGPGGSLESDPIPLAAGHPGRVLRVETPPPR